MNQRNDQDTSLKKADNSMRYSGLMERLTIKRVINGIFIIMIILSISFTYIFYRAWNPTHTTKPPVVDGNLQYFHIDSCLFRAGRIEVVGWAFIPGGSNILNRIYAEIKNGDTVEIMNSLQQRRDVSDAFKVGKMYDNAGFIATRLDISNKDNFTNNIYIVSTNKEGVSHASKYECK
ncbi:TPA: hypothetical protein ACGR6E_004302 [Enterobacter roggenkampii]